jgi:hypothetical protein
MIITKNIVINISKTVQITYYYKKYKILLNIGDNFVIPISKIPLNSHIKIKVLCDICGKEHEIKYQTYNHNTKNKTEKYYCSNVECMKIKRTISINKKYGIDNIFQNENIKNKIKQSNLEKYGVDNPQKNKEIKIKSENTNLIKYGYKNVFQNENIKEKSRKTNLKKYGVDYAIQNKEIFNKITISSFIRKKYKDTNIHYQGSYELDFLEKYYDKFDIENGKTFKYFLNNKKHIYYSDFYIPSLNLVIEIKSNYIYELHKEKVIEKERTVKLEKYNYILILNKDYSEFNKKYF